MTTEHWGTDTDRGNKAYSQKKSLRVTMFATNPTQRDEAMKQPVAIRFGSFTKYILFLVCSST